MNKKYIIMSDEKQDITQNLSLRYNIIKTDVIEELLPFERRHADIQCLKINDTYFVLKEAVALREKLLALGLNVITTESDIGQKYPSNVLLNAVYMNEMLFCKADAVDRSVTKYCEENRIKLINVNQGYTKCSTAVLDDCFITADKGIFKAMTENGVEGLLIESGDIDLDGVDYGFIGGCCLFDDIGYGHLGFTGNIFKHKSYEKIEKFLCSRRKSFGCFTDKKLYDIGGFVII